MSTQVESVEQLVEDRCYVGRQTVSKEKKVGKE